MEKLGEQENKYLSFSTVDVFTTEKFTGNQLAVITVPTSARLSPVQKQTIAKEFNYSESVFVHSSKEPNVWSIDIFTVNEELPFAGHPVIGTACLLLEGARKENETVVRGAFLTRAGRIDLEYDVQKGVARAAIPHNIHIHSTPYTRKDLERLQPAVGRIPESSPFVSIVRGMTFVLVELQTRDDLTFVNTTPYPINTELLDKDWESEFVGSYFYYRRPSSDSETVRLNTRMIEGSLEDTATGSAACTLAVYLSMKAGRSLRFEVLQGEEMGRRSEIFVDVTVGEKGGIETVFLSGATVKVMEGRLSV